MKLCGVETKDKNNHKLPPCQEKTVVSSDPTADPLKHNWAPLTPYGGFLKKLNFILKKEIRVLPPPLLIHFGKINMIHNKDFLSTITTTTTIQTRKIPHTGDTESLDQCG